MPEIETRRHAETSARTFNCADCTLRRQRLFRPMSADEVATVGQMKRKHLVCATGSEIVHAGERSRRCLTLFSGWALRYHRLKSGARQILDVLLPGDTIALDAALLGANTHTVQAATPASFCALDGLAMGTLIARHPQFATDLLRSRVTDGHRADARSTMLGRLGAEERVGYLLIETFDRLRRRGMASDTRAPFPLRRTDIADAVGLSKVHVMRALRSLRADGLAAINGRELTISDPARLAAQTGYVAPQTRQAIL